MCTFTQRLIRALDTAADGELDEAVDCGVGRFELHGGDVANRDSLLAGAGGCHRKETAAFDGDSVAVEGDRSGASCGRDREIHAEHFTDVWLRLTLAL